MKWPRPAASGRLAQGTPARGFDYALSLRVLCRQNDLAAQEVGKFDSDGLEGLWIERSLGQTGQGVGLEIDQLVPGNDEVGTGIAATRQGAVYRQRLLHDLRADLRGEAPGADFLGGLGQVFGGVVEPPFRRDDLDRRQRRQRTVRLFQRTAGRLHASDEWFDQIFLEFRRRTDGDKILPRIDENQAVARSIAGRLCDQPAIFGERPLRVGERHAGRRARTGDGGEALGG